VVIDIKTLDKESVLSEEVFIELLDEPDKIEQSRMLLSIQDRAKELGVKAKFDILWKNYKSIAKTSMPYERYTDFNVPADGEFSNMRCGSWICNGNGVVSYNVLGMEIRASYQPLLPIERLENIETGEEQIVLAFYRDGRWKKVKVPKETIASSSKIVGLSRYGLSVNSEMAKHMVKYLTDIENLNAQDIMLTNSTCKLGWIGNDFIPYNTDIVFDGDIKFKQLFESIRTQGSEELWIEHAKDLRKTGRPEIKFMLAASFASVLIKPLGILPFFVDLWGETEGGKSVSLMLAASVWANPDASQYIGDYKSTDVALEVRADVLNNLPVLLDDTSNATKKIIDDFENVVYRLCSGKGKSRSNKELGSNRENTWKTCFITNGERELSSYLQQGGGMNRIIEIEAGSNIYQNPQKTANILKMNYGFAGKRFIDEVKQIDNLKERYDEMCSRLFNTDKMQKQTMSLACLLLADEIATETIFKDGANISIKEAESLLVDRSELSENERCYRYILDKTAMNNARFDETTGLEKWGFIKDGYVNFFVSAFDDRCREGGFSKKGFLSWARKKNLIITDKDRLTKVVKIGNSTQRVISIKLDDGLNVDQDGFVTINEDQIPDF